jgi:hypothetical protein
VAYGIAIIEYGASGYCRDGYEYAINILAATDKPFLLCALKDYFNTGIINEEDKFTNYLDILVTAIAYADSVATDFRLELLKTIGTNLISYNLNKLNKRIIKASIIDALIAITDESNHAIISMEIDKYAVSIDTYISDYAGQAKEEMQYV